MPRYRVTLGSSLPIPPYECEAADEGAAIEKFKTDYCRISATSEKWNVECLDSPPVAAEPVALQPAAAPVELVSDPPLAELGLVGPEADLLKRAGITTLSAILTHVKENKGLTDIVGIMPRHERKIKAAVQNYQTRQGK